MEFVIFASFLGTLHVNVLHRDLFFQTPSDLPLGDVEEEELLEMVLQEGDNHSLLEGEGGEEEGIDV